MANNPKLYHFENSPYAVGMDDYKNLISKDPTYGEYGNQGPIVGYNFPEGVQYYKDGVPVEGNISDIFSPSSERFMRDAAGNPVGDSFMGDAYNVSNPDTLFHTAPKKIDSILGRVGTTMFPGENIMGIGNTVESSRDIPGGLMSYLFNRYLPTEYTGQFEFDPYAGKSGEFEFEKE